MGEGHMHRQRPQMNYIEVMSLRAWSSSSLMALYLSFWEYNSSIGIRDNVFDGGEIEEGGEEEVEGRDKNRCRSEASNPAARRAPVNRVTDSESMTWRQRERESGGKTENKVKEEWKGTETRQKLWQIHQSDRKTPNRVAHRSLTERDVKWIVIIHSCRSKPVGL